MKLLTKSQGVSGLRLKSSKLAIDSPKTGFKNTVHNTGNIEPTAGTTVKISMITQDIETLILVEESVMLVPYK